MLILKLPASRAGARAARRIVHQVAGAVGVDGTELHDMTLAVGEACANVAVHAYPPDGDGDLTVQACRDGDRLVVTVADRGSGFGPSVSRQGLGLGIPLMTALADELSLGVGADGGTLVTMRFNVGRWQSANAAYDDNLPSSRAR